MKKSMIAILMALLILFTAACSNEQPDETPDTAPSTEDVQPTEPQISWMTFPADRVLTAQQYFVYSCETGKFITIAESETTKIYPASVTKLFTAYVALQYLNPTDTIVAGDVLKKVVAGSSVAEIKAGDSLTVEQLVEGMLLPSGNDAAYVLAEAAGKAMEGSKKSNISTDEAISRFVKEMNEQAKLVGMTGTNFANPDGIHSENHYTTYADLAIMGTLALEDPVIMRYAHVSTEQVVLTSGNVVWKNTNALIDKASPYYCPHATGLKTGQTPYAGSCLLSSFEYQGQTLIIGVFGCPGVDDRFPDTLQLFNEAMDIPNTSN